MAAWEPDESDHIQSRVPGFRTSRRRRLKRSGAVPGRKVGGWRCPTPA